MKNIVLSIIAAMLVFPLAAQTKAKSDAQAELKVMSYNIRVDNMRKPVDGTNSWLYRHSATLEMLQDQKPDVFGIQEALLHQIMYIQENCRNYKCVGVGREDGKKNGEHMSIFWDKDKIKLMKWGTFWLSETPDEPSKGWDAGCKRTATWALMKDKRTGNKFYFVNTHLDHVGVQAQKNGLQLIVDRIASINPEGYPMVLTGDFNVRPENPALVNLDKRMDSARKIAPTTDNHDTYNGWGKGEGVIDYIYVSGFSHCLEYQTVKKRYDNRAYVSDHYPIFARLIF